MNGLAVVTGAGSGIGRKTAESLSARGLAVALVGRRRDRLEETQRGLTGPSEVHVCDVSSSEAVARMADAVLAHMGVPTVLVYNAGIAPRKRIEALSPAEWDSTVGTNLSSMFYATRALLPAMKAARVGRIVCVGSISSTLGTAGLSAYCASKWGVLGFSKSLAEELRGTGLSVMSILPGSVDTEMLEGSGFPPQMSAEEVAKSIVYLALDAPDAMNGSAVEMFGP